LSRNFDGFVKSPSAALRFTFVAAAYHPSMPHSSGFARLASESFYAAIALATFYEIINFATSIRGNQGRTLENRRTCDVPRPLPEWRLKKACRLQCPES